MARLTKARSMLSTAARRVDRLEAQLAVARRHRDELIYLEVDKGRSGADIAREVNISKMAVSKILAKRPKNRTPR